MTEKLTFYDSDAVPMMTSFTTEEAESSDVIGSAIVGCLCVILITFVIADIPICADQIRNLAYKRLCNS